MAGGPNLCPREATTLEHIFALVLSSWLAFGPSRSRYARVGTVRETSEKELILCNQLARRQVLLELGGFNEVLYPNEENALMDEVQKRGGKLIYDPDLIVYRRPRSNLKSFARMLMTYGRGRAEQLRAHPTLGSAPNLAPPLLLVYLVLLPFIYWLAGAWGFVLLGLYVVALAVQASALPLRGKVFHALAAIPLIVLTHLLYGFGFWRGLFTKFRSSRQGPAAPVVLETVGVQYRDVGTV